MAGGRFTQMAIQQFNQTIPANQPDPDLSSTQSDNLEDSNLTPKDKKLEQKLQRKVNADDAKMRRQHPEFKGDDSPPRVHISNSSRANGDTVSVAPNDILIAPGAAHDKKNVDAKLAHETCHQLDKYDGHDEQRADVCGAQIVGPQKTINDIADDGRKHPEFNDPKVMAKDPDHHGTTSEREQNVANHFKDQKLKIPKQRAQMQP